MVRNQRNVPSEILSDILSFSYIHSLNAFPIVRESVPESVHECLGCGDGTPEKEGTILNAEKDFCRS